VGCALNLFLLLFWFLIIVKRSHMNIFGLFCANIHCCSKQLNHPRISDHRSMSSLVQTKIHIHGLALITSSTSSHRQCNWCGVPGVTHTCEPCRYSLCGSCVGHSKMLQAVPLHHHPLEYTATSKAVDRWCDACGTAVPRESWYVTTPLT
jgi:hypothetical protein